MKENINTSDRATTEICTFSKSLNVFDTSPEDISRTTHRFRMFSYDKEAELPILYRHYKHFHDDEISITGYKTMSQEYYTVFVFVDGKIGLFVSDTLYTSDFGKIVTLNPQENFTLFIYALENLEYYEFDFPIEYFGLIPDNSPMHSLISNKQFSEIKLKTEQTEKLFHILNKIDKTIDDETEYKDFTAYSLLVQAISLICNNIPGMTGSEAKLTPLLKNALEYISENLTNITDTKQVADYCSVSVSYLCRMFRKYLDTSPLEYINNQKLLRARFLLKNGHNVTQACFDSGFDNYNYFITKFKKTVGMTPTEYQKSE